MAVVEDLCWNVTELSHTRTESSWNWAQDDIVLAEWCKYPYSESIHGFVREIFPEHAILLSGELPWPARSPDLSVCDYFLWWYLNAKVYITRPWTIDDLKQIWAIAESTGKPESEVGRVRTQWWATSQSCAVHNGIYRDVTKCTWNKMAFSLHSFCDNKLKIKIKFYCVIYIWKSSGSFVAQWHCPHHNNININFSFYLKKTHHSNSFPAAVVGLHGSSRLVANCIPGRDRIANIRDWLNVSHRPFFCTVLWVGRENGDVRPVVASALWEAEKTSQFS
jgi:hypothetical protein